MRENRSALLLASALATVGTLHFLRPKPFNTIVPSTLPGPAKNWTYASGIAELSCAAAVAHPRLRRTGAGATAALFVAVFPANIKMAIDYRKKPRPQRYVTYARLPLQLPLIRWALRVREGS